MYQAAAPKFCRCCGEQWSQGTHACVACGEPAVPPSTQRETRVVPKFTPQRGLVRALNWASTVYGALLLASSVWTFLDYKAVRNALGGDFRANEALPYTEADYLALVSVELLCYLLVIILFGVCLVRASSFLLGWAALLWNSSTEFGLTEIMTGDLLN